MDLNRNPGGVFLCYLFLQPNFINPANKKLIYRQGEYHDSLIRSVNTSVMRFRIKSEEVSFTFKKKKETSNHRSGPLLGDLCICILHVME